MRGSRWRARIGSARRNASRRASQQLRATKSRWPPWRVHGTAAELFARAENTDLADHHRELSRATIMKLANSLDPEDPLRATFLSAPHVRRVIDYADRIGT